MSDQERTLAEVLTEIERQLTQDTQVGVMSLLAEAITLSAAQQEDIRVLEQEVGALGRTLIVRDRQLRPLEKCITELETALGHLIKEAELYMNHTAWAIQKAGIIEAHHPKCSAEQTAGAILCDCDAIYLAHNALGRPQTAAEVYASIENLRPACREVTCDGSGCAEEIGERHTPCNDGRGCSRCREKKAQ